MKNLEKASSYETPDNIGETLEQNLEELYQLASSRGLSDDKAKEFIKDWLTAFVEKRFNEGNI